MNRTEPLELVYFQGCPSVEAARAAIRGALSALGLPLSWQEWDLDDPHLPARLQAAGLTDHVWTVKDIIALTDPAAARIE